MQNDEERQTKEKVVERQTSDKLDSLHHLEQEIARLKADNAQLPNFKAMFEHFRTLFGDNHGLTEQAASPVSAASALAKLDPVPNSHQPATQTGGAQLRALNIFNAIKSWNAAHPTATFALTKGLLESTFGIHRQAAATFIDNHAADIQAHHHSIGVIKETSHNRHKGKDTSILKQFVDNCLSSS